MLLDVPTLFIVVTVVALVMALLVCVMAWGQPPGDALWAWALALVSYAASNVIYGMRAHLPGTMLVLLGNLSSMAALALMLLAVRRFQGVRLSLWLSLAPVLLVPPLLASLSPSLLRSVVSTSAYLLQMALVLQALVDRRYPLRGRGRHMLFAAFTGMILILLARTGGAALGFIDISNDADRIAWQAVILMAAICAVLSIALGFIYMTMERAEQRNYELAMKDVLTGLSNRRAISDVLQVAVARAQRHGQLLSVLMLDIDHFKRINDSYGHQAGDVVLRGVAQTLSSRLRAQDEIGRFGGEEFLVVLPDTGLDGALILAEALRAAIEATPTQWGAHRIAATISIGLRGGMVAGSDTADSVVAAADAALYRAKQAGRNRVDSGG